MYNFYEKLIGLLQSGEAPHPLVAARALFEAVNHTAQNEDPGVSIKDVSDIFDVATFCQQSGGGDEMFQCIMKERHPDQASHTDPMVAFA